MKILIPRLVPAICLCVFVTSAEGQISSLANKAPELTGQPISTTSFPILAINTAVGGARVVASMGNVNINDPRWVIISPVFKSSVMVLAPLSNLPNGFYGVQFHFLWVDGPPEIKLTRGSDTLPACVVQERTSFTGPEQICDTGIIAVTNNQLGVELTPLGSGNLNLTRITINTYAPPVTLKTR